MSRHPRRPRSSTSTEPPIVRCNPFRASYSGQRTTPMSSTGTRFAFPLTHSHEEVASVLKISRLFPQGRGLTIKLEGELLGPWVGSVRDACAVRGRRPQHPRLDLAAVTYVDAAGIQLLRELMDEGIEIAACSSFVGELLDLKS
jgi:ABC-type transporter Mla MlaB component